MGNFVGIHQVTAARMMIPWWTSTIVCNAVLLMRYVSQMRSRNGFALGAVMAAEWLKDTGRRGILTLDDYLNETFGE